MVRSSPKTPLQLASYVLGHPNTFPAVFAAAVLYMLYLTTMQHEAIMKAVAEVVRNQGTIEEAVSKTTENQAALIRLEDRQINLIIKALPMMEKATPEK